MRKPILPLRLKSFGLVAAAELIARRVLHIEVDRFEPAVAGEHVAQDVAFVRSEIVDLAPRRLLRLERLLAAVIARRHEHVDAERDVDQLGAGGRHQPIVLFEDDGLRRRRGDASDGERRQQIDATHHGEYPRVERRHHAGEALATR